MPFGGVATPCPAIVGTSLLTTPKDTMDTADTTPSPAGHVDLPSAPGTRPTSRVRVDPYVLAGVFFVAYMLLSITRWRRMLTMSWDLGIFEQVVKSYAHLHAPIADLKGPGFNILGDHFSPVTALVAPFYRVFPSPVTLLVAQALLFALAIIPVTRVAGDLLGRGRGLAVGIAFALSWGVQRAVEFDFHEIAFAMPLLAFSLEAVLRRRWMTAIWWAVPLAFVKEDLGITAAAIGAIVWWRLRGETDATAARRWALGLVGYGVVMSALAFTVIIPAFNGAGGYDYWNKLSGHDAPMPGHIPLSTAVHTLLWILLPTTGLLGLRSPLILAALPTLAWRFVSHDDHYWGIDWHYNAVLMPVLLLAMVDAVHRFGDSRPVWLRSYAAGLPALVAGAALGLTSTMPLGSLAHADTYRVDARTSAVERLLDTIPDGASVEANVGPISHLVSRTTVYWVGDTPGVVPDYMALDNTTGWAGDPTSYARKLHPGASYAIVGQVDGYVVLRRG